MWQPSRAVLLALILTTCPVLLRAQGEGEVKKAEHTVVKPELPHKPGGPAVLLNGTKPIPNPLSHDLLDKKGLSASHPTPKSHTIEHPTPDIEHTPEFPKSVIDRLGTSASQGLKFEPNDFKLEPEKEEPEMHHHEQPQQQPDPCFLWKMSIEYPDKYAECRYKLEHPQPPVGMSPTENVQHPN
jgi:hypothetical protein